MDPLDLAILALRLLLVALLYGFLLTVMRLALGGLRAAPTRRSTAQTFGRAGRLQLSVVEPAGTGLAPGEVVTVSDGGILGRGEHSELRLSDPAVSAEHARVTRTRRGWVVMDLGSTNGTRVNEAPISGETAVSAGDVLGVGNVRLRIVAR